VGGGVAPHACSSSGQLRTQPQSPEF
jgi:hypothetical protein